MSKQGITSLQVLAYAILGFVWESGGKVDGHEIDTFFASEDPQDIDMAFDILLENNNIIVTNTDKIALMGS